MFWRDVIRFEIGTKIELMKPSSDFSMASSSLQINAIETLQNKNLADSFSSNLMHTHTVNHESSAKGLLSD